MPDLHTRTQRQAQVLCVLAAKHTHTRPEGHGCPRMVSMNTVGQWDRGERDKWARECSHGHG